MNKSRIVLLVVAFGLVGLLYSLPKYVVENDVDQMAQTAETHSPDDGHNHDDPNGNMASHEVLLTDEVKTILEKLTFSFDNSLNQKEKGIFADSLRMLYANVGKLDSAAKYSELSLPNSPSLEELLIAGDANYEAFGIAMTGDLAKYYGQKAQQYYKQALKEAPDSLGVKTRLAMTYVPTSQPMLAAKMLKEVLVANPDHKEALFNIGMMSIQSFQYEKGVTRFKRLVKVDPQNLQAHFYLAVCYAELGKKESARTEFHQVKNMSDDPVVHSTVDSYLEQL